MADPLCHGTQGALMLLAPFISRIHRKVHAWGFALVGAILGMLPDLIGLYGYVFLHDHGRIYNSAHSGAIKEIIQYIPMTWLHLFFDSFMHDPDRTWEGFYVRRSLQVLLWMVNIGLIVWFVRIFKRNRTVQSFRRRPRPFVVLNSDTGDLKAELKKGCDP